MKLRRQHQVLVLLVCVAVATAFGISGCAGMAEPSSSLSVAPTTMSVSAKVGTLTTQAAHVTNVGTTPVSVSQVVVTGAGFSVAGLTTPVTLSPNQTQSFTVKFSPATAGSVNGSLAIMTDLQHRPVLLSLHATAATASPAVASVSVTPAAATPTAGAKVQFSAAVQGTTSNDAVSWTATTGTITPAGLYTAPTAASTGTVTATSMADPTKSASAVVTVSAASPSGNPPSNPSGPAVTSVTVSPATASSVTSGTLSFTASVQGSTTNKAVTWKATLGTITAAGAYTAPAKAGTDTVTAVSVADTTKSAVATVAVTAPNNQPSVTGVTVTPTLTSVTASGTLQFSATVQGTVTDKSVSWKAVSGSITSAGVYTAPSKAGSDTVTATSNADATKSASAAITVSAPSSNPSSPSSSQTTTCGSAGCPAFPEAEGSAAGATGGRGGVVIEVTNLNDSGTGSLRSCVEASGPRTCVFRVGGVINVSGDLRIGNPYLTVAGQTAPGGGIKLAGTGGIMWVNTHDVVIRYLSYDGNSPNNGPAVGSVAFDAGSGNTYNVIFDHISGFHVSNKQLIVLANDAGPVKDVTFQWNMTYQPDANHPVGPMADATTWPAAQVTNIDYHHNFFADTSHRLPLFNVKSGRWVNNIVYNWNYYGGLWQGATTPDIIGNKYVAGNMNVGDNDGHPHPLEFTSVQSTDDTSQSMGGAPSVYLQGNIGPQLSDPNGDQTVLTAQVPGEGMSENGSVSSGWFRGGPLPSATFPIVADSATGLDAKLIPLVGNSQQLNCDGTWSSRRQAEDAAMIAEYQNRTPGSLWSAPSGYSTAAVANGTACTESMHDGIPDQWKSKYNLNLSDATLHNKTAPNGYTYLENYLNGTDPTK
jgi:Abnormal spindle-like microcephaly-assoc'd, ASPM-SPD-2-Hydin